MIGAQGGLSVPDGPHNGLIIVKERGWILNYMSVKLTREKLCCGTEWVKWRSSEWKWLDQCDKQGMFGNPV
jgi:hypothetical protein